MAMRFRLGMQEGRRGRHASICICGPASQERPALLAKRTERHTALPYPWGRACGAGPARDVRMRQCARAG
eukprot:13581474-Alexandrium_andersonii.AAC.1